MSKTQAQNSKTLWPYTVREENLCYEREIMTGRLWTEQVTKTEPYFSQLVFVQLVM